MLVIVSMLTFSACSSTDDYSANIYVLDEEKQELVLNPSIEYVVTALNQVNTITGIELDSEPYEGIMATVYFTSNLVDQSEFGKNELVHEKEPVLAEVSIFLKQQMKLLTAMNISMVLMIVFC